MEELAIVVPVYNEQETIELFVREVNKKTENLEIINDFLAENLIGCPMKLLMQKQLAVEEIFVNIAHYAYKDKTGDVNVLCELDK